VPDARESGLREAPVHAPGFLFEQVTRDRDGRPVEPAGGGEALPDRSPERARGRA
jgi:hypothetical protein